MQPLTLTLFLVWLYLTFPHYSDLFPQNLLESGPCSVRSERTQNDSRSEWNAHITLLILEATLLVQAKTALIFLAVRSHYWPALSSLTTLTPQAFHINLQLHTAPSSCPCAFWTQGQNLTFVPIKFYLVKPSSSLYPVKNAWSPY